MTIGRCDCRGFGLQTRVGECVVAAGERRRVVRQERRDRPRRLRRSDRTAPVKRAERDAVRIRLGLEPPGTQTQAEPPVGDVVDGHRRVRRHRGMAVVHAVDHATEPQPRGERGERGEHRPALEVCAVHRGSEWVEVVHRPCGLEHVDVVGGLPDREEVGPRAVLGRSLDAVGDHGRTIDPGVLPYGAVAASSPTRPEGTDLVDGHRTHHHRTRRARSTPTR